MPASHSILLSRRAYAPSFFEALTPPEFSLSCVEDLKDPAALLAEGGRSPSDILEDLQGFYFDTALSGSPAALPSLPSSRRSRMPSGRKSRPCSMTGSRPMDGAAAAAS